MIKMKLNLQKEIQEWWNTNPMIYDWEKTITFLKGSCDFFEEIDRRFFSSAFYAQNAGEKPFSKFIDFSSLKNKYVLEVGCGLGSHAKLLSEAGCKLTAIDITWEAVKLTKMRLSIYGLKGNILQADAERLPFKNNFFDFIWSWGVIHHSSSPMVALSEMCRVLKSGNRIAFMVYNRNSLCYWVNIFLIRGIFMGRFFFSSMEGLANKFSDGLIARYYNVREINTELSKYCKDIEIKIAGQFAELLPLPAPIRKILISLLPMSLRRFVLSRYGGFLLASGIKR